MKMGLKESVIFLALSLVALAAYVLRSNDIRSMISQQEEIKPAQDILGTDENIEVVPPSDTQIQDLPAEINAEPINVVPKKINKDGLIESKPVDELQVLVEEMKQRKVTGNGDLLQLEERTLYMVIKLEQEWGEQLEIKWAKRDARLNHEIGGRTHSQHLHGKAIDITHEGWSQAKMRKFIRLAYEIGFRGFGIGNTMVHIDTRNKLAAWSYPGSIYPSARKILRDKPQK